MPFCETIYENLSKDQVEQLALLGVSIVEKWEGERHLFIATLLYNPITAFNFSNFN